MKIGMRYFACFSSIFLITLLLVSCGQDAVSSSYKTYGEVQKAGVIEKGWVPAFLPTSAVNIKEIHNVEVDSSRVEFTFKTEDSEFLKFFTEADSSSRAEILRGARLDAWSHLKEHGKLRAYVRSSPGVAGYLVIDFSTNRTQYWENPRK